MLEWVFALDGIKYEWPRTKDKIEEWIDNGAFIDAKNEFNETICMEAAIGGYTDTVRKVAELGAYLDAQNNLGWTACMLAAARGYTDTIKVLTAFGANPNVRNKDGRTACIIAAKNGYTDIVKTLVGSGANIYIRDNEGMTVLDYIEDKKVKQEIINTSKKYVRDCLGKYKIFTGSKDIPNPRKVATQELPMSTEELWKDFERDS